MKGWWSFLTTRRGQNAAQPCPSKTSMQRNECGRGCLVPGGKQPWRGHVAGYKIKEDDGEVERSSKTSSAIRVLSGWKPRLLG